jgi:hypothetical protein
MRLCASASRSSENESLTNPSPFLAIFDAILAEEKARPKKQQHTSRRIFERLRERRSVEKTVGIDLSDHAAILNYLYEIINNDLRERPFFV